MANSYQKTAKDTLIVGATTIVTSLAGLVQVPLLTKGLGAHDYGLWSQIWVTVSLALPFVDLGLITAMIRFLAAEKDREKLQEGFYSTVAVVSALGLAVALGVLAFSGPLARSFFDGSVEAVRITGVLILLAALAPVYLNLLRTLRQVRTYSLFIIADTCGQVGLTAYLVFTARGVLAIALSIAILKAVLLGALFILVQGQIGIKRPRFDYIREYLAFGMPTVSGSLGFWLVNLSDRYVIGFFLGVTPVGVYAAAYGLGSMLYSVMAVLTFVLLATLSQLYDEGKIEEAKTHLSYSLKYFLAVAIPFVFGCLVLGEPVLRLFTTPDIAREGRFVVSIVALATLILGVQVIIAHVLILTRKTKKIPLVWLAAATLNIGLNIFAVPRIGILGAAITTLLAYALMLAAISYYSFREVRFDIDRRFIVKSVLASAIMSVAAWAMAPQSYPGTIAAVASGIAIYGIVIVLLRGFSREEFRFFRGLVRKRTSSFK